MKRIGNIFNKIVDWDNLVLADKKARLNKNKKYGIYKFDKNYYDNLLNLQRTLIAGKYKTSKYDIFKIIADRGNKEREIYRLPYYPDRIVHHAIMNVIEPILLNKFIADTCSCIKGRGIHYCVKRLKKALRDKDNTVYCLKLDIKKFFPNVDRDILMHQFELIFKDRKFLKLIKEIIYSVDKGIPIGNYISQYAANLNLCWFDRWLKQDKNIKYYFRYCDDITILHKDKNFLKNLLLEIQNYLKHNLKLEVKQNWQIFPVDSRGIDFLGYVFYHNKIKLRKDMKKRFYIKSKYKNKNRILRTLSSYWGWCKYGNCHNLWKKFTNTNSYKELRYILTKK